MQFALSRTGKVVGALSVAVVGALIAIGWSASAAQQGSTPPSFLPLSMSINQLMVALVDDAAHEIWEGGNTSTTLTGEGWQIIEQHALQLQAAATLVSLGGTGPADRGWAVSPAFQEWARKLRDSAMTAKSAADRKDQMALRSVGDALVDVCEGCHKEFKPDVPTEGLLHVPHYHYR